MTITDEQILELQQEFYNFRVQRISRKELNANVRFILSQSQAQQTECVACKEHEQLGCPTAKSGIYAQQPVTNQRLADAAPDLLDALKTVLAAHKEKPPTTVMQAEAELDRIRSAASKARKAIAKAEGNDQEIGNVLPEFQKFKSIESYESAVKKQGFVLNFQPPPAPEGDKHE